MTETHVQPDDRDPQGRMGRIIAIMADVANGNPGIVGTAHGIAVSASTAVLVNWSGAATVVGTDDKGKGIRNAYFLKAPAERPSSAAGAPLSWAGMTVTKVTRGGTFNLATWAGGDRSYVIDASNGHLSVEGNNDVY